MQQDITTYNQTQPGETKIICELLAREIQEQLKSADGVTSKIWHGSPVWFLHENPIVGYSAHKDSVRLLFWSGQSFDEPGLQPEGSFKAAEARYTDATQVNPGDITRWLKKAQEIQWDYKNIVKRKGVLERLS